MKYAFIFPGQGSQSPGMGKDMYDNFTQSREILDRASDFCKIDFKTLLFIKNDNLGISKFTQPAVVLNSFMCYLAVEESLNLKPELTLGHSLGEFSALGVSGGIDLLDTIKLVNKRGELMQKACEGKNATMMVVLGLEDSIVEEICESAREDGKQVWAANYNSDGQIVVAGVRSDLESLEKTFKDAGAKRALVLDMSVSSHCPMLSSASDALVEELKPLLRDSFSPVISNVTSKPYSTKDEALTLLKDQLVKPVLYKQSILNIEQNIDCFIEFGATTLKGINKKITNKPTFSITDAKSLDEFMKFHEENA
ncbi:ACP S-malonyltransferase [Campylobacter corcagiensis]|uniref:Malonyl CoA-acyl carrier protein transacylase n=1 Tax=Campylobacter corcagiensis TaxID=1448857 RepID=A0A7M1LIB4_9BACT|nr:ACP S-malonyltransferase [Campylobacter corcagiensis]QKF65237.1 malonyl-CoA-[acp] transacylase [Campylobacter corcagiensis]QOQ88160.1 ACP S-malonyltransferase [Campylobacter corcagiensis]